MRGDILDNKFKKSLGNLKKEPREFVWTNIETKLDETPPPSKKTLKPILLRIFYITLASIVVLFILKIVFDSKNIDNTNKGNSLKIKDSLSNIEHSRRNIP